MRNDKHIAIQLRKRGLSYNKISKELGITKSTLSVWLSNFRWSQGIRYDLERRANYVARKRLRLINQKRRKLWEQWREEARQDARKNFPRLSRRSLFVAGLMLYWGEGDSKLENSQVRLSNTDPNMIKLFALFLVTICKVPAEKLKAWLILYPDLEEEKCKQYWSEATGIPLHQFVKSQFIQGRHPTKRLSYGVCQIKYGSRQLKEKIFVWIDLFQKQYDGLAE